MLYYNATKGGEDLVDIHAHIIPGVDDGSDSVEESLAMIRQAYEGGTRSMVMTPHYLNKNQCRFDVSKQQLESFGKQLQEECESQGIKVSLYQGAEHFGVTEIGRIADEGGIIPINNSRYVLIEFDFDDEFQRVSYVLSQLMQFHYIPIIAHPERYNFLFENPSDAYGLLEKGCLLQVNKGSPLGKYGPQAQRLSKWLLDNHLVHFVASDCHSPYQRTPEMQQAHEMLTYRLGMSYVNRIFNENPLRVIRDEVVTY